MKQKLIDFHNRTFLRLFKLFAVIIVVTINIFKCLFTRRRFKDCLHHWKWLHKIKSYRLRHFLIEVFGNLRLGLFITAILLVLEHYHFYPLLSLENWSMDMMIRSFQNSPPDPDKKNVPFVFLEIDEDTYQHWGEPLFTPRDKLKTLIEFAAEKAHAKVVIVDVYLDQQSDNAENDKELREYLQGYSKKCEKNESSPSQQPPCSHIILIRSFRAPVGKPADYFEQRHSFLEDDAVIASKYVHWASNLFGLEENYIIRRWRLWEASCTEKKEGQIVPSIQLTTAFLIENPKEDWYTLNQKLQTNLGQFVSPCCNLPQEFPLAKKPEMFLELGNKKIDLNPLYLQLQQRIIYNMPWKSLYSKGGEYPTIPQSGGKKLLTVVPVKGLIDSIENASTDLLKDSIVLIGGSFKDSHDVHATPLGEMPGTLVIANAIYSLLQYGDVNPPEWYQKLGTEIVLIIVISALFALSTPGWGLFWSLLFTLVLVLPLSFKFFKFGVWWDFAIPTFSVLLHHIYEVYKHGPRKTLEEAISPRVLKVVSKFLN
ncbi:MAG: hypothetical protein BWK78_02350 [Thiotrichaceae bacterium IS1]|nr:MAG: hypothetical protein BWK78_02350 [Thiotrichaceae bacterium IS1]